LQLYIEGPNDKVITFLEVEKFSSTVEMGFLYKEIEGLSYLSGHSMNELFHAEQIATETALTKNLRPNCSIVLPEINENTLGQVIFMLEVQTAFAGYLYNINPFDQPGVEEGKQFAYGLLGRKGFENKKTEIENRKRKIEKYLI
jgi:glucose-6-phosphate isomerase